MTTRSLDVQHGGWARRLFVCAGAVGHLGATGCLVPDTDYCAFLYGDLSCPAEQSFCVLAKEPTSHTNIDDGCSATVPKGFVRVHYGLPTSIAAPAERPDDPRSLEGILAHLGYDGCGSADELDVSLGPAVAGVADVRRHLGERGHTRRAAMALESKHVGAIGAFDAAVTTWIDACTTQDGVATTESEPVTGESSESGSAEDPCDAERGACVSCSTHEQCESGACDLLAASPTCFEPENVLAVGQAQQYTTITEALAAAEVSALDRVVVRLHDGAIFDEVATITAGTIAFVAAPGDAPRWRNDEVDAATLHVTGDSTRVYVDRLRLEANSALQNAGLLCNDAAVHVRRSRFILNSGPGISALNGCDVTVLDSFVGGGGAAVPALTCDASTVTIDRSTLFNSDVDGTPALECSFTSSVTLTNSIVVTEGGAPGSEMSCIGADVSFTAAEAEPTGSNNVGVGAFPDGSSQFWFAAVSAGDFHLQNQGLVLFADVAEWHAGDASTDIDGDPRPLVDGTPDFAGADVPQ